MAIAAATRAASPSAPSRKLKAKTRAVMLLASRERELVIEAFRCGAHGVIFRRRTCWKRFPKAHPRRASRPSVGE